MQDKITIKGKADYGVSPVAAAMRPEQFKMEQDIPQRYYHGGPKGLRMILPSQLHGTKGQRAYGNMLAREDKVYVTTDYAAALMFASCFPKGSVYEVLPVGELVADPDCAAPGLSYECDKAKVIRETRVKPSEAKIARQAILVI